MPTTMLTPMEALKRLQVLDLRPSVLVTYLETKSYDEVAGRACHGGSCPLVNWIATMLPEGDTVVTGEQVRWRPTGLGRYAFIDAPRWVQEFVRQVDSLHYEKIVTVGEALKIARRLL